MNGDSSVLDSGWNDAAENFHHVLGPRVRRNVPVVGALPHNLVAHGSAHKVSLKARLLKERIHFLQFIGNLHAAHFFSQISIAYCAKKIKGAAGKKIPEVREAAPGKAFLGKSASKNFVLR